MYRAFRLPASVALAAAILVSGGCTGEEAPEMEEAVVAAPAAPAPAGEAAPSAGDREFARLTASWSQEALDGCGTQLRDALGTRDLVQGAVDGVSDPAGKAASEIADAKSWIEKGDAKMAEVEPQLEAGTCDGVVNVALDEAWQFYVKAGTSAVQAQGLAGA